MQLFNFNFNTLLVPHTGFPLRHLLLQKLLEAPKILGVDTRHFSRPCYPVWGLLSAILDFACARLVFVTKISFILLVPTFGFVRMYVYVCYVVYFDYVCPKKLSNIARRYMSSYDVARLDLMSVLMNS